MSTKWRLFDDEKENDLLSFIDEEGERWSKSLSSIVGEDSLLSLLRLVKDSQSFNQIFSGECSRFSKKNTISRLFKEKEG